MDYEKARYNMVECQIRPWDVLDFKLLDAIEEIPREIFVQDKHKELAYAEVSLPVGNGSYLLEPKVAARMIQALQLKPEDVAMEIGTRTGYGTAILCKMCGKVDSYDIDAAVQETARKNLESIGIKNFNLINADGFEERNLGQKIYDAIYVGGAMRIVPEALFRHLNADGGHLIVIEGETPVMSGKLYVKNGDDLSARTLFETKANYLVDAADSIKKELFSF